MDKLNFIGKSIVVIVVGVFVFGFGLLISPQPIVKIKSTPNTTSKTEVINQNTNIKIYIK